MPNAHEYTPRLCFDQAAVIQSGQQASGVVDLAGTTLCGLFFPAAFTGATVTFQGSPDGANFSAIQGSPGGADYSVTVTVSKYVAVDLATFAGVRYLKVVSASAEGAQRSITLAARPV